MGVPGSCQANKSSVLFVMSSKKLSLVPLGTPVQNCCIFEQLQKQWIRVPSRLLHLLQRLESFGLSYFVFGQESHADDEQF